MLSFYTGTRRIQDFERRVEARCGSGAEPPEADCLSDSQKVVSTVALVPRQTGTAEARFALLLICHCLNSMHDRLFAFNSTVFVVAL